MTLIDRDKLIDYIGSKCVRKSCNECHINELCVKYLEIMTQPVIEINQEEETDET